MLDFNTRLWAPVPNQPLPTTMQEGFDQSTALLEQLAFNTQPFQRLALKLAAEVDKPAYANIRPQLLAAIEEARTCQQCVLVIGIPIRLAPDLLSLLGVLGNECGLIMQDDASGCLMLPNGQILCPPSATKPPKPATPESDLPSKAVLKKQFHLRMLESFKPYGFSVVKGADVLTLSRDVPLGEQRIEIYDPKYDTREKKKTIFSVLRWENKEIQRFMSGFDFDHYFSVLYFGYDFLFSCHVNDKYEIKNLSDFDFYFEKIVPEMILVLEHTQKMEQLNEFMNGDASIKNKNKVRSSIMFVAARVVAHLAKDPNLPAVRTELLAAAKKKWPPNSPHQIRDLAAYEALDTFLAENPDWTPEAV